MILRPGTGPGRRLRPGLAAETSALAAGLDLSMPEFQIMVPAAAALAVDSCPHSGSLSSGTGQGSWACAAGVGT